MRYVFLFVLSMAGMIGISWGQSALKPEHVLVLYNETSSYSRICAQEYARVRNVPNSNLVPLPCSAEREEISRGEYDETIEKPLLREISHRNFHIPSTVGGLRPAYVFLIMPNVPLKVKATSHQGQWMQTDAASVDSELACLAGIRGSASSAVLNPYYEKDETIVDSQLGVNLVCRIDAADKESVSRMILDPTNTETDGGLWGRLVVDEGGPYKDGDNWLKSVVGLGEQSGFPVMHDTRKRTIVSAYPLGKNVAVYFGWYATHADGPFGKDGDFFFQPGAIAVHMHSFSCVSLKNSRRQWCAPLLARGASVTLGNVYEPYLGLLTRPDIFFDRLLKGYTLAEAAWMATPALSWQNVVLGDPLYRPFAARNNANVPLTPDNRYFQTWKALMDSSLGNESKIRQKTDYASSVTKIPLFDEFDACRAMERKNWDLADARLRLAANRASDETTSVRLGLLRAELYLRQNKKKEGVAHMHHMMKLYGASPYKAAIEAWYRIFVPLPVPPQNKAEKK